MRAFAVIALLATFGCASVASAGQIKDLPAAVSAASTDQLPIDNASNQTRKLTLEQVKTYLEGALGTAQFRLLLDDTNASDMRSTIGAIIGTNVQAWDADLDSWAGKTAPSGVAVGTTDSQTLTNKTLTSPVISGGTINNNIIGGTTAAAGTFTTVTGNSFTPDSTTVPSNGYYLSTTGITGISQNGRLQLLIKEDPDPDFPASGTDVSSWLEIGGHRNEGSAADGSVFLRANGSGDTGGDYSIRLTATGANGGVHLVANEYIVANFAGVTMADDHLTYLNFSNADDGNSPAISVQKTYGGDSDNFGLNFYTVGTATNTFRFLSDNASVELFQIRRTASGVNYPYTQGSATGNAATIGVDGSDTNASLTLNAKGNKGVNIEGTATNDSAASGYVGEYVSASLASGSAVSLTDDTAANVQSISLTAGDWNVCVNTFFSGNAATIVYDSQASISTTSATLDTSTDSLFVWGGYGFAVFGNGAPYTLTGCKRVLLSATTTVYQVAQSNFATNTAAAYGSIWARRVR